jgi:biotin transport system substrate-specific component
LSSSALLPTLVRPSSRLTAAVADTVLVAAGVALLALCAQVSVSLQPITPVPLTGQTFGALLVAASYGAVRATATVSAYLVVGGIGLPVFAAQSSGWGVLTASSTSGGYLVGMLIAAAVVGLLSDRRWDRRLLGSLSGMVLGSVVIYVVGAAWLAHALGVGPVKAWELGIRPFLIGDTAKVLLAACALPAAWRLVDRARR